MGWGCKDVWKSGTACTEDCRRSRHRMRWVLGLHVMGDLRKCMHSRMPCGGGLILSVRSRDCRGRDSAKPRAGGSRKAPTHALKHRADHSRLLFPHVEVVFFVAV